MSLAQGCCTSIRGDRHLRLAHGWKHLDGDNIMHRKDAESLKLTKGLALWHIETVKPGGLGLAIASMSKVGPF